MATRATTFNDDWIKTLSAESWLTRATDPHYGRCTLCSTDIVVSKAGIGSLKAHSKNQKHLKMVEASKDCVPLNKQFQPAVNVKNMKSPSMQAELCWVLHSAESSKSFSSEYKTSTLFKSMFPDSNIAKEFSCGRNKQAYLLKFALAPYFRRQIMNEIGNSFYSIAYDEADGRLMLMIRYINDEGFVRCEMLDLVSLEGDFTAENCASVIRNVIDNAGLARKRWISDLSTEGP